MAEVDLATISINSNLVRLGLRIRVLGTQITPRRGLMMAEVDLATINIRRNRMMWVVDPVSLRIPTL
jgi:hypothetical protein